MKTKRLIAFMLVAITVFTTIPLDKFFVEATEGDNTVTLPSGKAVELESDIPHHYINGIYWYLTLTKRGALQ